MSWIRWIGAVANGSPFGQLEPIASTLFSPAQFPSTLYAGLAGSSLCPKVPVDPMYAMCRAHFSDQPGFSLTRPGSPFAARAEFSEARIAAGAAPMPAAAVPAATSATTARLRRVARIGASLIGAQGRWLYSSIRRGGG